MPLPWRSCELATLFPYPTWFRADPPPLRVAGRGRDVEAAKDGPRRPRGAVVIDRGVHRIAHDREMLRVERKFRRCAVGLIDDHARHDLASRAEPRGHHRELERIGKDIALTDRGVDRIGHRPFGVRSEEHTSELQSLMRISYAVFCLKKKNKKHTTA